LGSDHTSGTAAGWPPELDYDADCAEDESGPPSPKASIDICVEEVEQEWEEEKRPKDQRLEGPKWPQTRHPKEPGDIIVVTVCLCYSLQRCWPAIPPGKRGSKCSEILRRRMIVLHLQYDFSASRGVIYGTYR